MRKYHFLLIISLLSAFASLAADPMLTSFSYEQCSGSLMPYPVPQSEFAVPDSLVPVMINHVGRHGSRFPASASHCRKLADVLDKAEKSGTITQLGRNLQKLVMNTITVSEGRWGALDSLGTEEQRGIASRMYMRYPSVFNGAKIKAISSYSPRCMMSMYDFTHQIDRIDNKIEFTTSTGRQNSYLLRPFDTDAAYLEFREDKAWSEPYDKYYEITCPVTAVSRILGKDAIEKGVVEDLTSLKAIALTEYYVIAGLAAISMPCNVGDYFTLEEYNALWSCFNLRQYLQRTASTISAVPADIASALLLDIVETTDAFIEGKLDTAVVLRFGHAETLMPLLSLMRLPGCYYMTNYFDTVASHWQDFHVVPMAANLQIILFKSVSGKGYYVRIDLNENPVQLLPNNDSVYLPWSEVRAWLMRCIPLYLQ